MTISNELLDELLKGCKQPEDLLGDAGLMKELKIRLMERMLGTELTANLGYEAGVEPPAEHTNRRNGSATKRVKGSDGEVPLSVPRDREGSFEHELVKKGQTRIDGVDDKIIGLYAAGLSVRDIQTHLEDLYGLRVSPDLISRVTDAVLDEVREWQHRALDRIYPIVIFDRRVPTVPRSKQPRNAAANSGDTVAARHDFRRVSAAARRLSSAQTLVKRTASALWFRPSRSLAVPSDFSAI